jgi:hypothetical protein
MQPDSVMVAWLRRVLKPRLSESKSAEAGCERRAAVAQALLPILRESVDCVSRTSVFTDQAIELGSGLGIIGT